MGIIANPPIDYTSKDYAAFRQDMIDSIATRLPAWTSRSPNDIGIVLIELFAYQADILSFYGDRIASEAFLDTATQRQSVLNIASMLNYQPAGNIASTTTLTFTIAATAASTLIPAKTKVSTTAIPGAAVPIITFETDTDLTIPGTTGGANVFTGTATATQGITKGDLVTPLQVSDGTPGQEVIIPTSPIIFGSAQIYVDEGTGPILWNSVTNLGSVTAQALAYNLYTDGNGIVHVYFGDNINGHIPAIGSNIYAIYRIGGGQAGNVGAYTGVGTGVSTLNLPIANVISVNNGNSPAIGGADAESTDTIRINAPQSLQAINRAVSLADYSSIAVTVPGVQYASAAATVYTNVIVYIAPQGGGYNNGTPVNATTTLKNSVTNFFTNKMPAGSSITLADYSYVPINFTANVSVLPTFNRESVRTSAIATIRILLAFNNIYPNERISVSAVFQALQQVPGVNYVQLTLLARVSGTQSGTTDIVCAVNELPAEGTITITADSGLV
jgi:hypothetical protein